MGAAQLLRHHATLFPEPELSAQIEALRFRWDPQMTRQIAAHVTLVYPEEVPDPSGLDRLVRAAAASTPSFHIALGHPFYVGSPAEGVFLRVHDLEGSIASFRAKIVPPDRAINFPTHVTIVHPRTSSLGDQAWRALTSAHFDTQFTVTHVAITATDGDRWHVIRQLALRG